MSTYKAIQKGEEVWVVEINPFEKYRNHAGLKNRAWFAFERTKQSYLSIDPAIKDGMELEGEGLAIVRQVWEYIGENWVEVSDEAYNAHIDIRTKTRQVVRLKPKAEDSKPRCCGMCDGYSDICITDTECDEHKVKGCTICWPHPKAEEPIPEQAKDDVLIKSFMKNLCYDDRVKYYQSFGVPMPIIGRITHSNERDILLRFIKMGHSTSIEAEIKRKPSVTPIVEQIQGEAEATKSAYDILYSKGWTNISQCPSILEAMEECANQFKPTPDVGNMGEKDPSEITDVDKVELAKILGVTSADYFREIAEGFIRNNIEQNGRLGSITFKEVIAIYEYLKSKGYKLKS